MPLGGHFELSKADCPDTENEKKEMGKISYALTVGSVMFLMLFTRPALALSVSVLSRFMSNPGMKHWIAMEYLLRHIFGTKNFRLVYGKFEEHASIKGYVDSDYASNNDNRKPTTAFLFQLG